MKRASKTRVAAGVLGCLTALTLALPASAHCGGRSHARRAVSYTPVCTVEDCEIPGRHFHDGVTYCGTCHADGVCTAACYSVPACTVEGCEIPGRHLHDGVTYCGACHEDGVCTAACYGTAVQAAGRHHGGHHGRHC